jgi:3-deoxy-D-manno-octulosonic acid (KDO) 8-phosphate synthase
MQKKAENKLKYNNLSIEIQRMCNMKCFVIPVIFRATGIVSKSLKTPGNNTKTTLNRFPTKNCHTRNITLRKESATS